MKTYQITIKDIDKLTYYQIRNILNQVNIRYYRIYVENNKLAVQAAFDDAQKDAIEKVLEVKEIAQNLTPELIITTQATPQSKPAQNEAQNITKPAPAEAQPSPEYPKGVEVQDRLGVKTSSNRSLFAITEKNKGSTILYDIAIKVSDVYTPDEILRNEFDDDALMVALNCSDERYQEFLDFLDKEKEMIFVRSASMTNLQPKTKKTTWSNNYTGQIKKGVEEFNKITIKAKLSKVDRCTDTVEERFKELKIETIEIVTKDLDPLNDSAVIIYTLILPDSLSYADLILDLGIKLKGMGEIILSTQSQPASLSNGNSSSLYALTLMSNLTEEQFRKKLPGLVKDVDGKPIFTYQENFIFKEGNKFNVKLTLATKDLATIDYFRLELEKDFKHVKLSPVPPKTSQANNPSRIFQSGATQKIYNEIKGANNKENTLEEWFDFRSLLQKIKEAAVQTYDANAFTEHFKSISESMTALSYQLDGSGFEKFKKPLEELQKKLSLLPKFDLKQCIKFNSELSQKLGGIQADIKSELNTDEVRYHSYETLN